MTTFFELPADRPYVKVTTPLEINVTKDHVKRGTPLSFNVCPAALACKEADPDVEDVGVLLTRIYVIYPNRVDVRPTGAALRSEIVAVDRGGRFAPGTYVAPGCPPSMFGKPKGKVRGTKGGKRPLARHLTASVRGRT